MPALKLGIPPMDESKDPITRRRALADPASTGLLELANRHLARRIQATLVGTLRLFSQLSEGAGECEIAQP